jgi:hypothetical protein
MTRWSWLSILSLACLFSAGCDKHSANKPDPTKGRVTGIVLCADTGKPARFAQVILSSAKIEQGNPLPASEEATTDLDGRFTIEAVEPGHYYAYATQEGYLDPMRGLDFSRLHAIAGDQDQEADAIKQWKDHLVEVAVHVHRTAELSLQIERAAEIGGTVTFDDGSPAIGMRFQLFRKTEKNGLAEVGLPLFSDFSLSEVSDGHGHFNLTNLPAGEYAVCALMPSDSQDSSARVCLGNTFRKKQALTVKVQAGEIARGEDIEISLSGLHTVAGFVTAAADGHALNRASVRLLYADDREKARESSLNDGGFSFAYVPEGSYILQVSGAQDAEQKNSEPAQGDAAAPASNAVPARVYMDKELPVTVMADMDDIQVQLNNPPPDKPQQQ